MLSLPSLGMSSLLPEQLLIHYVALACPQLLAKLLDCISLDACAPVLQGITRMESDELWQQHAGPVLAPLDIAGQEAVLAVLFQLMELTRCRRTIEGKGWWSVTAKLVAWIYCSRTRGMQASDCLKGKRKATAAEVNRLVPHLLQQACHAASPGLHGTLILSSCCSTAVLAGQNAACHGLHGSINMQGCSTCGLIIIPETTASHSISLVQVKAARPQADWYLFGGAECKIGKTFACVVGAVACQEWHLICICLTYTASVHVKDLRDKMIFPPAGASHGSGPLRQHCLLRQLDVSEMACLQPAHQLCTG